MPDISMRILLSAQDQASGVLKGLGNSFQDIKFGMQNMSTEGNIGAGALTQGFTGVGNAMWAVAGAAVAVGAAAAIGIGVIATKAAADYQQGLTTLVTGAGEAQSNIKMVGDGMLDMAVKTGTGTKALTDGMYMIESAGFHGAQGLTVLQAAAQGAKVGNADLGVVANAVTTVLTDYHMSANQAASATSGLVSVVASGKTKLQDLSSAMSVVLPLASSVHVGFNQVGAAMATMTNGGETARHAAQMVAFVLRDLVAPSSKAQKSMLEFGLSAQEVGNTLQNKGLPAALQLIEDHVGKKFPAGSPAWNAAMKSIMGGATGLNAILELGGKNMQTFKGNVDTIGKAMQGGSKDVQGWSAVQQNFNFKWDQLNQVLQTSLIKIGQQLLPVLTRVMVAITPIVTHLADWLIKSGALKGAIDFLVGTIVNLVNIGSALVNFFQHNQVAMAALQAILIVVAGVIIVSMVMAFYAWAVAAGAAAIATLLAIWPILLIAVIVVVVVAIIILAVRNWGAIAHWLQGIWAAVLGWLSGVWGAFSSWFMGLLHGIGQFFTNIWNGILNALRAVWNAIVNVVKMGAQLLLLAIFGPIIGIVKLFEFLYNHNYYFKALVDTIVNVVKAGLAWLQNAWSVSIAFVVGLWNNISKFASQLWSTVTAAITVAVQTAWDFLVSIWTTATGWLGDKWNQFSTLASNAWGKVSSVFSSIWGTYIAGPMGNLWNQFSNWFSNIASQAVTWGQNLIQGFINGIKNMAGQAGQAAQDIIKNVASFMGFHSPSEKGPGRELMTWGPGLVQGFSQGMLQALPTLDHAVQITATHLTPLAVAAPASVGGTPRPVQGNRAPVVVNVTVNGVIGDKRQVVDWIENELGKRVRTQYAGYASGGIF